MNFSVVTEGTDTKVGCTSQLQCSWVRCCVVWQISTNIVEEPAASCL